MEPAVAEPVAPRRRARTGRALRAAVGAVLLPVRAVVAVSRLVRRARDADPERRREVLTWVVWALAVVASLIAFGTAGYAYDTDVTGLGVTPFLGALVGLPFGLVLARPALGWAVSASSAVLLTLALPLARSTPWPWGVMHGLVLLALLFAVCARRRRRDALAAWLGTALLFAWGVPEGLRAGWVVGVSAVAVLGVLAGVLTRTSRALARQTRVSSQEKEARLVLQERTRIARDLHDIVAHHMSLIVVQTETAPYRVPDLPEPALAELRSISESARRALAETRSLLTLLRQDDEPAERAPQPDLWALEDLFAASRRAGVDLEARVDGLRDNGSGLRPGVALAAYRIVQEALANASRHSPGSHVRVEVLVGGRTLDLTVSNDRPIGGPAREPGTGHGLTGMRERALAEGGSVVAGPDAGGGYTVVAHLPLDEPDAPALDAGRAVAEEQGR